MSAPFAARYPGECQECGGRFESGAAICYDATDQLVHAGECPEALNEARGGELCGRCFCYHAGECA